MSITVDYSTIPWLITVPKSDLTLESGTKYTLTVDEFWSLLRDYADSYESIPNPIIYTRIPATASTPSITAINLDYYLIQFEDGAYSVNIINGNTNIREAEVKNSVSVNTNNTTGFIDPTFLEAGLFNEGVVLDTVNGVAGTGKTGAGAVIGTRQTPSDNLADTLLIAVERGQRNIIVKQTMAFSTSDLSSGYSIIGDTRLTVLTLDASVDVTNCSFSHLTLIGDMDGANTVDDCLVNAVTNVSGVFHQCSFASTVLLNGDTDLFDCFSRVSGPGYPSISAGAYQLTVRNFRGSFGLDDTTTGHLSSIGVNEGKLIVESTCSGGTVHMRGIPFGLTDDSGASCTVLDETEGVKVAQIPFDNGVAVDTINGFAGTGLAPNGQQIGTRLAPCNNFADTKTIVEREGFANIYIINNATSVTGDFSDGYNFIGDTTSYLMIGSPTANLTNCTFREVHIGGKLSGANTITEAIVFNTTDFSGTLIRSKVSGTIVLVNTITTLGCWSFDETWTITSGNNPIIINDHHGSLTIDGMLAGDSRVELYGGILTLNANCTGGTVTVLGGPTEIIDNSTGTTVVSNVGNTVTKKALTLPQYIGLK